MGTLKPSTGEQSNHPTLFAAAILANLSQPPAKGKANKIRATYGLGLESPYAFLDPVTQSWKMYKATYLLGDLPSLEKLPNSGITVNGVLFQRPQWGRHTEETDSLSWPTPTARDWKGAAGFKDEKRNLSDLTYLAQVRSGTRNGPGGNGGSLNPEWVEWLMGFPPGWTDLKESETQ